MPNPTIAESSFSHIINAPIERVDIADWLLHLPSPNTSAAAHRRISPVAQPQPTTAGQCRPTSS
jgi:hypothetical protein